MIPLPVQVIPSGLVAMVFPPVPTATHKLFPYATSYAILVIMLAAPLPVHVSPFVLVTMEFPIPSLRPTATHK